MKKLLTAMCLSMLALAMAGALAACNENDEDAHTHDMTKVQAVAATCTEDGNEAYYKCSECGKYFSDEAGNTEISLEDTVIAATGHKVEKLPGKAATCTEDGLTEGEKCSVCGEVIKAQEVIKAAGHTPEVVPGKAAQGSHLRRRRLDRGRKVLGLRRSDKGAGSYKIFGTYH